MTDDAALIARLRDPVYAHKRKDELEAADRIAALAQELNYAVAAATIANVGLKAAVARADKAEAERERWRLDSMNMTDEACRNGEALAKAEAERDALLKFKKYTHQRFDELGVPHTVPSPHTDAGCRVGGRFDWIVAERDAARLPRFNDEPGEGCPAPSQCLHIGSCLRRCNAARSIGLGLEPGDNLFINCTVQEAPK